MKIKTIGRYEIHEPTVGDVPELFDIMCGTQGVQVAPIVKNLMRNCVYLDGEKLGDRIDDLPIKDVRALTDDLVSLAGLGEKK